MEKMIERRVVSCGVDFKVLVDKFDEEVYWQVIKDENGNDTYAYDRRVLVGPAKGVSNAWDLEQKVGKASNFLMELILFKDAGLVGDFVRWDEMYDEKNHWKEEKI